MENEPVTAKIENLVDRTIPDYLQALLKDKQQLQAIPNKFECLGLILDQEITRVRDQLHQPSPSNETAVALRQPSNPRLTPSGNIVALQEKVYVPIRENPSYNFVGRLLGPRGLTAKQLEQDLECKIMVRGRGSLRDKKKEDLNRGKPNWEHLEEDLHVLISVEDFDSRARAKLQRATHAIRIFLEQGVRTPENEDKLKQLQLMELAVLNDKDRHQQQQLLLQQQQQQQHQQQHQLNALLANQSAAAVAVAQLLSGNASSANPTPASNQLARLANSSHFLGLSPTSTTASTASQAASYMLQPQSTGWPQNLAALQLPAANAEQLAALLTGQSSSTSAKLNSINQQLLDAQSSQWLLAASPSTNAAAAAAFLADPSASSSSMNAGQDSLKMRGSNSISHYRVHPYMRS